LPQEQQAAEFSHSFDFPNAKLELSAALAERKLKTREDAFRQTIYFSRDFTGDRWNELACGWQVSGVKRLAVWLCAS